MFFTVGQAIYKSGNPDQIISFRGEIVNSTLFSEYQLWVEAGNIPDNKTPISTDQRVEALEILVDYLLEEGRTA